jgi:two-component system, OmpR family, response regulator ChvI
VPKPSLLLVDDDAALLGVLAAALEEEGFEVATAADGRAGLARATERTYDLVVLDVLMPELDGLAVCRRLRERSRVPVIFLTSRAEEIDRVTGLETGADDYLTKPFSTRELVARIRAVLRRTTPGEPAPLGEVTRVGRLTIDSGRVTVTWDGREVALTRSEFLVLAALARHPGYVLGRERLIELARGEDVVITERTIDTFIKRIRQKLHAVDPAFDAIETVVGVGYRLKGPR